MANEKVKFKLGLKSKLPAASSSLTGLVAFVTDTGELFVYNTNTTRVPVKTPTVGALTLTLGSTSQGAWDGSSAKSITINPSAIGAEPSFSKNTAFNKNFGSAAGTVTEGNDPRLSDSRPASDVSAWAKAATKPTYTPTEVGVIGTAPTSGQVAVFDGTTGKIKSTGFTIASSVPAGAKFTDTTYTNFVGSSSGTAGSAGLVPAPSASADTRFLGSTGLWTYPPSATTVKAGYMSAADKKKLDGIADNANNYSLPLAAFNTRGGVRVGYTTSGKNYAVQLSNEQMYVNVPWENTTYTNGDGLSLSDGTFSIEDTGVTADLYGPGGDSSPLFGGTFMVPYFAVNSKGQILTATNRRIKIPSNTFVGASTASGGTSGLVPAPSSGAATRYLRSDGTWVVPPNTTYTNFVKSGTGAKSGLVPAPAETAGTTKFLCEDATWKVPPDTLPKPGVGITVSGSTVGLANSGVPTGTYGPTENSSVDIIESFSTISVPSFTVDQFGRLTMAATRNIIVEASNFVGATTSASGEKGLVPRPTAGSNDRYLRSDGVWMAPPTVNSQRNGYAPKGSGDESQFLNGRGLWSTPTSVTGNAGTATKLQTSRTISLTGVVTGNTTFDGSANKSITTTLRSNEIVASATQPSVHKTGDIWIKIIPD